MLVQQPIALNVSLSSNAAQPFTVNDALRDGLVYPQQWVQSQTPGVPHGVVLSWPNVLLFSAFRDHPEATKLAAAVSATHVVAGVQSYTSTHKERDDALVLAHRLRAICLARGSLGALLPGWRDNQKVANIQCSAACSQYHGVPYAHVSSVKLESAEGVRDMVLKYPEPYGVIINAPQASFADSFVWVDVAEDLFEEWFSPIIHLPHSGRRSATAPTTTLPPTSSPLRRRLVIMIQSKLHQKEHTPSEDVASELAKVARSTGIAWVFVLISDAARPTRIWDTAVPAEHRHRAHFIGRDEYRELAGSRLASLRSRLCELSGSNKQETTIVSFLGQM